MKRGSIFFSLTRNYAARSSRFILRNRFCFLAAIVALPLFYFLLWISGLSDFFYETPFEEFYWPPFVDVRKQVVLELLYMPTETPIINHWEQFQPIISPSCKRNRLTRKRSILTIVKSAPGRIERRRAIRSTYGSSRTENFTNGYRFQTIFVMGRPEITELFTLNENMTRLRQEADLFDDLLIGDFTDNYFNNTFKFIHSISFANNHCGNGPVSYVLLLDDDYLLLPWNLAIETSKHVPNERLYMGWRYDSSPFRLWYQKFHVSIKEYPFDAYPPYITAGAVLLTGQTVKEFHAAIQHTALYRFDDIYAGILAYLLVIQAQHNPNFLCNSYRSDANWWSTLIAIHDYTPDQLLINYAIAQNKYIESKRRP